MTIAVMNGQGIMKAQVITRTCKNCVFYTQMTDGWGECRYAATVLAIHPACLMWRRGDTASTVPAPIHAETVTTRKESTNAG